MTEEEKRRIISLSSYQPDSTTDYRTAQVAVPKDFDYDEYQRRMDMIKRGKEIQNLGLYEQAGIENTGLPYYQVGKRDTQLTPEQYASFAQREGFDPEDYYSSLEWMNQNVNPLTKDLNNFNIGLAGAKEGLRTPLREQLLGPQHASTSYGSFEWSPEEVTVDRTGRRVFDQRTRQTKANERAGKPATYLETQGTLAYPAWEEAYNAGSITTPWEEGVVDQKGLVTGDSELYNAENAAEIQGTTKLDKKIEPKVKWSNKVLLDQEPYPKITIPNVPPSSNAYGGFMNRYNYGSYLDTASMEAMTGAEAAASSMNEGGLTDKQTNAGMAGLQGLSAMGNTMGTEPKGEKEGALDQAREGAAGANPIIGLFHGIGKAAESGSEAIGGDDNFAGRGLGYAANPFGAKMETLEDPNLTGQDKAKVMAMQVFTAGMGDKDMLNLEGIEKQDTTAFNYGAYGGNLYAAGGFMQPTIDPEHRKKYKAELRNQENDAKVGMTTLDKWTEDFPTAEKWMPYTAVEDKSKKVPTYDIGYGNKIGKKDKDGKLMVTVDGKKVDAMKGLNTKQIESLFDESITAHEDIARKQWNERYPEGTQYDDLSQDKQVLVTDFAYNLGSINKFPSFMDALSTDDKKKAFKEYKRNSSGKPLTKRNKWTEGYLNKIFPIIKKVPTPTKLDQQELTLPTGMEDIRNVTPTTNIPAVAESTGTNNKTQELINRSIETRKLGEQYLKKDKKAYGGDLGYYGDLQPMPMMSPQPLPVNTPGIQSHVNYDPEVLQGRMEKLYNPQRNAGRSTHLNQDTGERRNANFFGDLFKPNTRRTSVEGGQYANGGNIDNLYQAGGNLTEYNGNTHEVGGIPLGNTNNEVEDGEIRWDTPDGESYIFSNRIPYTKSKKK